MRKCFFNFLIFIVTGSIFFVSCVSKDVYALPPIPEGELQVTDKNMAKPDEIKLYSDKKVLNLSEAAVEKLWAALDSIFNAGYGGDGYYDIGGEEGIKKLKKTETCLELLYGQMQTSKQSWEAEGENCRKYFGALTILTPLELRYIRYFESYDEEGNLCFHTNFFARSVSGEEFAARYAELLSRVEELS